MLGTRALTDAVTCIHIYVEKSCVQADKPKGRRSIRVLERFMGSSYWTRDKIVNRSPASTFKDSIYHKLLWTKIMEFNISNVKTVVRQLFFFNCHKYGVSIRGHHASGNISSSRRRTSRRENRRTNADMLHLFTRKSGVVRNMVSEDIYRDHVVHFEQLARRDFPSPTSVHFTHPERQAEHWWCNNVFRRMCWTVFFQVVRSRLTSESELCFILCSVFRALNEMC